VARVALLCPDLLFGSKVEGGLAAGGHEVTRFDAEEAARSAAGDADVLIVDLTADSYDGAALVESLRATGEPAACAGGACATPALGFYSHVDTETRKRAEQAGFDLVVPRSRMAREMGALVDRLAAR
jgi:CheY-like chemotaxis protein